MTTSRREFFRHNPKASAWAELDKATNQAQSITNFRYSFEKRDLAGKSILIIGAGVSGLTAAYELASSTSARVTVLEAQNRTGGRCLSLRTGDTVTEDVSSDLESTPSDVTQVVRFEKPVGDAEPFLNAGPGRIPSTHVLVLDYLRRFNVPMEVYVMHSDSNLVHLKESPLDDNEAIVARQLIYNMRGWMGEMVHQNAKTLLEDFYQRHGLGCVTANDIDSLQSFAESFGDLTVETEDQKGGLYMASAPVPGQETQDDGSDRHGYTVLPGVQPGKVSPTIMLNKLLDSRYWEKVNLYQQNDILWQPTLMHPTFGMDQVEKAFAAEAVAKGATILLNSPVRTIGYDREKGKYIVSVEGGKTHEADYVMCNIPMPFLQLILADDLYNPSCGSGFNEEFKLGLRAVFETMNSNDQNERFLAPTTKVGWQADRDLWQRGVSKDNSIIKPTLALPSNGSISNSSKRGPNSVKPMRDTQVGVVPIFGGISWTDNIITQIWYPSVAYHDEKGVLTGTYNFGNNAIEMGKMPIEQRLAVARKGAVGFGELFAKGLDRGVAIAWQNMPYIKGGWAQWHTVRDSVRFFNELQQGTGVDGEEDPSFFVIGDQMSSLPGWQEGAVAAALNAISRMSEPRFKLPYLKKLPDTRIIVEGV